MKFIKKIKYFLIEGFYSWYARRALLHRKRKDLKIFEILEAYLTEIVVGGNDERRKELAQMQAKIGELKSFIKFTEKIR